MKALTRSQLIKRIDRLCQTVRRWDGAFKKRGEWHNVCVSSGKTLPMKQIQAGHLFSRACYPLRWDERNINPQSAHDNCFENGAFVEYSQWFIKKYGQETYDQYTQKYLDWKHGKIPPYSMDELKEIYNDWLKRGRELEQKIGPQFPPSWQPFDHYEQ